MRNPWMVRFLVLLMALRFNRISRVWQALIGIELPNPLPEGLILPHPYGVVIHQNSHIGSGCAIWQNVTIGSDEEGNVPRIGSNVRIYAGACIIGAVVVGDNAIIGANAVVLSDVPPGHTAVGVPARTFKRNDL